MELTVSLVFGMNINTKSLILRLKPPPKHLHNFVEFFWMLKNTSEVEHKAILVPDGRFDLIFSSINNEFDCTLRGLDIEHSQSNIPSRTTMYGASFKLLAIEYLLEQKVDSILNHGVNMDVTYWGVTKADFNDFDLFWDKVVVKLTSLIKPNIDNRKQQLFDLIYASNGAMPVKELSEKVFWESRQINRYFTKQFGISLKTYCNIIRFRSSLPHIKKGRLYPELSYSDQNHFIREVKRMAGVTPKELARNENDRFILLSALPEK